MAPADSEHRMKPLTVIAMTVAVLAIAAAAFAVLNRGFRSKTKVVYQVPAVFKLRAGDCFNSDHNGIHFSIRACSTPHDAEVFATFPATGKTWPGSAVIHAEAEAGCASRVAGYMNPALASGSFDQEFIYPDQLAWQAGVRAIVCDVRSPGGPITGSVRQTS